MDVKPACSVDGCERESASRGWCSTHYTRWRRTGEVGTAEVATKGLRYECVVTGCQRDATSRKMCGRHYLRVFRNGTLETTPHAGPGSPRWVGRDALTYDAAHDRVQRACGSASARACVECGLAASDWAYQHTATDPLLDDLGRPFSDNLDDYAPMCRTCHRVFDMQMSWRQQGGDHLFVVTVDEVATYAGVSVNTVRSWVKRGKLSPIKAHAKPLLFRYDDAAAAQAASRSQAWRDRHTEAVARWRACA